MTISHDSTNGGREQNWIDNLQVPEELDYIKRLQAMNLDPQLLSYWIAMEVFRARRGSLSMAKLTTAVTAGGAIVVSIYTALQNIGAI